MSTVAARLHEDSVVRLRGMTPAERLAEALMLGKRAASSYAAAHGLLLEEAQRALERAAQAGRRPSRVMRDLAG